jgi:hypothetical protein
MPDDDELAEPPAVAAAAAARPECRVVREQAVRVALRVGGGGEGTRDVSRSWWLQCPGEPRRLLARASRTAPVLGAADDEAAAAAAGIPPFLGGGGARLDLDELLRDFLRNGRRVPPIGAGERGAGAGAAAGGATAAERLGRAGGGTPV